MKRRWSGLWWLLLLVPVVFGLSRLRINTEVLDLLPPDQPAVQGLKIYQQHFANARELIITLRAADAGNAESLAEALAARLRKETNLVAAVSWQPPWMENPAQAAEIVSYLWFNQPPAIFGELTNRLSAGRLHSGLTETREVLATSLSPMDIAVRSFDPYDLMNVPALKNFSGASAEQGQRMFASSDGALRVLYVAARPDLTTYTASSAWLQSLQKIVAETRANQGGWAGVVVRYTGRPAFVEETARGMQHDLSGSVTGTALIIAMLFWLVHRRWLPMLWLLTLLAVILIATVALGSLILGTISVISLGFAAVLLGLAVDYAVVHYQEALSHPQLSISEIRRAISPSILWAAITTISAFLVLNFGGLPGLAQLGTLVAIGVALAALVMVLVYLPPLFPARWKAGKNQPRQPWLSYLIPPRQTAFVADNQAAPSSNRPAIIVTFVLAAGACCALSFHLPPLDRSANALKPQHSEAEAALEEMTAAIDIPQDPLWVIISGQNEQEVYATLTQAEGVLRQAVSNRVIGGYLLPTVMWPRVEYQQANRAAAAALAVRGPMLRTAAVQEGFETNALFLTDGLLQTWERAGRSQDVFWPTNDMSQWLLKRFVAHSGHEWFVMGLVYPASPAVPASALAGLSSQLAGKKVLLSSWGLLGQVTLERVRNRMWLVVTPMIALVLGSLWLAFRRPTEVLLGLGVLLLSSLCLLVTMSLAGWSWNLLNLMAVPLILGTGVDYGIFMQLALRRHGGDAGAVRRSIGRALLLCGGTAIAGFGSLAWSGNAGMASLGKVCAVGIAANVLIAVALLPAWWSCLHRNQRLGVPRKPASPSIFYSATVWRLALGIVRIMPDVVLKQLCLFVAEIYYFFCFRRREVIIQNLLPVMHYDRRAAEKAAHRLFRQFAVKMKDLWRYEGGIGVNTWLTRDSDWAVYEKARQRGRGVLLITPHLGNWEIGGPLLVQRGGKLITITQAEPGRGFTEIRRQARARWGIETVVVGDEGFAFVEIIKQLQDGATVALLIDRPPSVKSVTVTLFGRPFQASLAAAELARATGCALVGVTITRANQEYEARLLAEFEYDRQALGNREERSQLTQKIMRAFEPEIQQHADQWFHFASIWPESSAEDSSIRSTL
jgi:predicted RND superfamily exporter protein/lauroyl/myristoyl acyltransferase